MLRTVCLQAFDALKFIHKWKTNLHYSFLSTHVHGFSFNGDVDAHI